MVSRDEIFKILENVCDPEVPALTIIDLGIVRDVIISEDEVEILITPTYSGCPAMNAISAGIRFELIANGFEKLTIKEVLSPAWTTDWMSAEGKRKLKEFGIAPPQYQTKDMPAFDERVIPCPYCNSRKTEMLSEFGSTSCKSLFRCTECLEPFDYFKCH